MIPPDAAEVAERLRADGIDVIRVSYPDLIGIDRGRDVLVDQLPAAARHGLAFCRAVYHTSPMGDVVPVQGGLESGLPDIAVFPDLTTVTPLPWEQGAAWCLGDAATPDGDPAPESPRVVVRRVAQRLAGLGYTMICGPELEFFLCQRGEDGAWRRYADEPGNVYVVGRKGDPDGLLLHMLRQLRDAGLRVIAANHEFSPGQFEINLGHSELTDAADRAFRLKSAVQEIARHRGMLATFMAKPFNDEGGSGFHVHVSLNDEAGANVFGDTGGPDGLSAVGRHAIGGVLRHARALSALLNPTINSYKRFGPDTLAPWLIDWGLDNRSAMLRIPPERGAAARMEIRLGDATANPYLGMAAIGAAVCLGIEDKTEPPEKLEGYGYDPGRSDMLPMRLTEALAALEADRELTGVLGEYFTASFLSYKRDEIERFERFVTDWEFREYAYHL
ncbi:MAG TPA: glutamine synthetase family protein [Streptosporangiaceae bacterium]|jgi:glutamine synthetase|nr:glutamine synthetase family protein [Streptosporangiaceae bacterium]